MRKLTLIVLAAVIAAFAIPRDSVDAASNSATTKLHIEGMTCGSCATAVKIVLKKTPGVVDANVSYEQKQAVVTYDATKTSPAKIANEIATSLSYKVTVDPPAVSPAKSASTSMQLHAYRNDELRNEFNRASDRVRVIALLSPTCGECQRGQRVVQSAFTKYENDKRLRGFVVWLPMLSSDNESAANAQAGSFLDARVAQRWDGNRASGKLAAKTLSLKGDAWDVYLLYAPGVKWTGDALPAPTFWMHQLRAETGADQRVCLNSSVFAAKIGELLRRDGKKG